MKSRFSLQWAACGLLLAALVPGCGGSTSNPVGVDDFSKRLARLVCERLVGCCQALARPLSPATCNGNASAYFQAAFDEQDPTKVRYDGSAAEGCLAAYDRALSGCTFDDSQAAALNTACHSVFVGLVPVGGACQKSTECASQTGAAVSCEFSGSGSAGVGKCTLDTTSPAVAPHGEQGQACAGSCTENTCDAFPSASGSTVTAICFANEGLYCAEQNTCQPTLSDGQPCNFYGCKQSSYCDANRVCSPRKADGAACSGSGECSAHNCRFSDGEASSAGTCGPDSLANEKTCAGNFE